MTPQDAQDNAAGARIARSRLVVAGGYTVMPDLFSRAAVTALFYEAMDGFAQATEELADGEDHEEWRGGLPPRKLMSAPGGPVQDALYAAPGLSHYLSEIVGTPVEPTSNRASYSYYCRDGDHLGLHRDVERCDLSVIVAVSDDTSPENPGGELVLWPTRMNQPLSVIRNDPRMGTVRLKLRPGETLVLAGGLVPHLVRPMGPGQHRITAPMCFKAL
jgi:hypothetical protein